MTQRGRLPNNLAEGERAVDFEKASQLFAARAISTRCEVQGSVVEPCEHMRITRPRLKPA
jgi:hypothetical protein